MAEAIGNVGIVEETMSPDEISFLQNIALADLKDPECSPDKLERAFRLSELYADRIPLAMTGQFFKAATGILLNDDYPISTRMTAARAANDWIKRARDENDHFTERKVPLIPSVPAYFKGSLMVGRKSMSKADVKFILKNFENALWIDNDAATLVLGELCSFITATFIKFRDDVEICHLCHAMFELLGMRAEGSQEMLKACREALLAGGLFPVVANMLMMNTANDPALKHSDKLIGCALRILNVLLPEFWPEPRSRLIHETAYSVFRCLLATCEHDYNTLSCGCWIITYFIEGAGEIIIGQKYDDGKTAPQCILEIAARALKARQKVFLTPLYSSHVFGLVLYASTMVKKLIDKLQAMNKNLELVFGKSLLILFEAVLSELRDANINEDDEMILLMIYARFMTTESEVVLDFLSGAASPPCTDRSAMAFVIADGLCQNKCERFSRDNGQVVKTALSKVLEYSQKHQDSELHRINLKGTKEGHGEAAIPLLSKIRRILAEEQTVQADDDMGTAV